MIFGQNVTLACYTQHPSKDCSVRQWTLGANVAVLLYNNFSYRPDKYADDTQLNANHFSLVIKNFSLSDVNQMYSCSCGFDKSSKYLSFNETTCIYKARHISHSFNITNKVIKANLNLSIVYPVPRCVLFLKNRQVETNGTTTKHGLLYDVNMSFIYHLTDDDDCDYWRPYIQCNYSEGVRFTVHANASYSIPCKGMTEKVIANTTNQTDVTNTPIIQNDAVIYSIICVVVLVVIIIGVAGSWKFCLRKKKDNVTEVTEQPDIESRSPFISQYSKYPARNPTSSSSWRAGDFDERKGCF